MDYLWWVALYVVSSLVWAWILFWGGAEWLEGTGLTSLFAGVRTTEWSAEGIKIFAGGTWLLESIWFGVGLFSRDVRHFFL